LILGTGAIAIALLAVGGVPELAKIKDGAIALASGGTLLLFGTAATFYHRELLLRKEGVLEGIIRVMDGHLRQSNETMTLLAGQLGIELNQGIDEVTWQATHSEGHPMIIGALVGLLEERQAQLNNAVIYLDTLKKQDAEVAGMRAALNLAMGRSANEEGWRPL
jgi:hypothetical protein